jgi:Skp family chaperone for outer membrane proteins
MIGRMRGVVAAAALATACAPALGAGGEKVAVVDMRRVMEVYPDVKTGEAAIRKQIEEFETEQESLMAQRDGLRMEWEAAAAEAESKVLSDKGREEKRKAADEKRAALRKFEEKIRETMRLRQKQLTDEDRRMRERIAEDLRRTIEEALAGKGYTLVLDSSASGLGGMRTVLFHDKAMDVTDEILKRVTPAGAPKAPEAAQKPKETP